MEIHTTNENLINNGKIENEKGMRGMSRYLATKAVIELALNIVEDNELTSDDIMQLQELFNDIVELSNYGRANKKICCQPEVKIIKADTPEKAMNILDAYLKNIMKG